MRIRQVSLDCPGASSAQFGARLKGLAELDPELLLVFGDPEFFRVPTLADTLELLFPEAVRAGCSTPGAISDGGVDDRTCVVTAVQFDHGSIKGASIEPASADESFAAGARLAAKLEGPGLQAVLLFGHGRGIDGSALLRGITKTLGAAVAGGLADGGGASRQAFTLDSGGVSDRRIVAVGLYGQRMAIGRGSSGGWQAFGPSRRVTRCHGKVLAELDGESALTLYKRYLGMHARQLPAALLRYPFQMLRAQGDRDGPIRAIVGIDESRGTLQLADEIDPAGYLRLMHASSDALIDGAEVAARDTARGDEPTGESLAMLVSCTGRQRFLGSRVAEEVEAVAAVLGADAVLAGFYARGEFGPVAARHGSRLHNQTMTVMRIGER